MRRPTSVLLIGFLLLVGAVGTAGTANAAPAADRAFVAVSVATVWTSPGSPRPVDRPAVSVPADPAGWVGAMSEADRLDLTTANRTQTQALLGTEVVVLQRRDGWAHVVVTGQSSAKDPRGYPGWVPDAQLAASPEFAALVDVRPAGTVDGVLTTGLYSDVLRTEPRGEISTGTRLPVLTDADGSALLALPDGGSAWADAADVRTTAPSPTTGADLVRTAQRFDGRAYVWGGRSGFGVDCSGLTGLVYALHGITIGRDASDQQRGGRAVPTDRLALGDLLFYGATAHHVAMYAGNGQMVEAFDAATPVRTTPVRLGGDFSGARRYLG